MMNLRNPKQKRAEALSQLKLITAMQTRMASQVAAELRAIRRQAAAKIAQGKPWTVDTRQLMAVMTRNTVAMMEASAQRTREAVLVSLQKMDTIPQRNEKLKKWAEQNAARKVDGIRETTRKRIANEVSDGLAQGLGPRDVAKAIESATGIDDRRAAAIARTEMHAAAMTAQQSEMEDIQTDLGITYFKEWVATSDGRTRDAHSEVNGTKVAVDDSFTVTNPDTGEADEIAYPGDPSGEPWDVINCRCTVVYDEGKPAAEAPDPKPAEEKYGQVAAHVSENATTEERQAVSAFTGDSHRDINLGDNREDVAKRETLLGMFDDPGNVVSSFAYRGISAKPEDVEAWMTTKTMSNYPLTSWTTSRKQAIAWATDRATIPVLIKGVVKGVAVSELSPKSGELELMVKGGVWAIRKIQRGKGGITVTVSTKENAKTQKKPG